jgi:Alcohol dehydrogenase GroES-like domain
MASNRGVVYLGPGNVEVRGIDYPKLVNAGGNKNKHGVILKVVVTNICGSDRHMVRGRTAAPPGLVLGHEITDLSRGVAILHDRIQIAKSVNATVITLNSAPEGYAEFVKSAA